MKTILGTLNFDYKSVSENFNQEKINDILNTCLDINLIDIDTAYYYGKTEEYLGNYSNIDLFKITSKANPWHNNDFTNGILGQLSKEGITKQINTSLKNLKLDSFDSYFLHCWDYETSINETLETFDEYYRKEKYNKFGISNISNSQLQTVLNICENELYNFPKLYQGMYNLYCRKVEEIFPILRDYNISFQAYNPLAGGLLTGKYYNAKLENGRFINNPIYTSIFWNEKLVNDTKYLNTELALKWLHYHSNLIDSDNIIIGSSSISQLLTNIDYLNNKNILTDSDLNIIEKFYDNNNNLQPNYFY